MPFVCLNLTITLIFQQIMIKVLSAQKSILWEPSDADGFTGLAQSSFYAVT
jgi:hypothetical protein